MEKIDTLKEMSNFVFASKYARYNEKEKRRETWEEAVSRVETMHLKKYSKLSKEDKDLIKEAFDSVREKKVVPSMRSMQFGGTSVEAKNARIYNCSVRHIDSPRAFSEIFFLALCGCGIGIGLQKQFLDRLPNLVDASDKTGAIVTYVVEDTIEGWSDSIEALLNCYFKNTAYSGRKIVFDFSRIRKKGSKIKTGGGKAPGYKPLKNTLSNVKNMLDALIEDKGEKRLRSIDVCDILCYCADAVLSGGVRRSALSFIFDKNDDLMMNAKTGNWFTENPQRARGNNSVLLLRSDVKLDEFKSIINKTREFGEPGFVFANDSRQLLNPCFSIDTKILTEHGWRSFENLLGSSTVIQQDKRVVGRVENGKEVWDIDIKESPFTVNNLASNIKKTGRSQKVYEMKLSCGRTVKATANHHFATTNKMVELQNLEKGQELLIPVSPVFFSNKLSDDYRLAFLAGMWFGDGTTNSSGVILDFWSNDKSPNKVSFLEKEVAYFIKKYDKSLKFLTNYTKAPKFSKADSHTVGNVTKYRLHSSLLKQIFAIEGVSSKDCGDWLHFKSKDFKSGFLSGLFQCDGHTEYNPQCKTLSIRLVSINFDLLKNVQLVLQELGSFSRINLAKDEGFSMLPDSNRILKRYETKAIYRLIIGGLANCLNTVNFLDLEEKDTDRIKMAVDVSIRKNNKLKFISKVESIKFSGVEDVYCLQEDNRRTLIAEGITARRCFEINFIPETEDEVCGVQFCNLTSINGALTDTKDKFILHARYAALIGTLQAGYLEFPYLSRAARKITEQEALLGVSITGMMDNPDIILDKDSQKEAALAAVETNEIWAKKLGVNPAARITCVKPEGTSSIILGAASGIHPHHSRRYFRRIQCNKLDNVYNFFKMYNPDLCEESVWSANKTDDVLTFPVEIPEGAMVKEDLTAIKHLGIIKDAQENWVNYGTSKHNKKNIKHSVSCTVLVDEDEWDKVVKYLFENRENFTAVSLLPKTGDKIYKQAPMEAVISKEDEKRFEKLSKEIEKVDYTKLQEAHDETKPQDEVACGGNGCEIK